MAKIIKNGVVKMRWEAENFIESRETGEFVAALHIYKSTDGKDVNVIFQNNTVFTLWDDDLQGPATIDELKSIIKDSVTEGYNIADEYEDAYIQFGDLSGVDEDVCNNYKLSEEDRKDMKARLLDLYPYYETVVVGPEDL